MKIIKLVWITIGLISFAIGTIGVFVPLLPTFPFYLLTGICFAKSSKKMHTWFINTKLYKNNFKSLVDTKSMTKNAKIRVMISITIVMGFGFLMMHKILIGRILLAIIWFFHMIYFIWGVKTITVKDKV